VRRALIALAGGVLAFSLLSSEAEIEAWVRALDPDARNRIMAGVCGVFVSVLLYVLQYQGGGEGAPGGDE
jgi:hypothetical protein